ncbi:MAG: ferritin-like domain-containing protein [Rhodothalassiaceae bacterium]
MSLKDLYPVEVADHHEVASRFASVFDWRFDEGRRSLLGLYEKGKTKQWNALERIDWSLELDPENPQQLPEQVLPIHDAPCYKALSRARQIEVRCSHQAWTNSQFLHGEQGALLCAAKIVQSVPDLDSKFYAATQVMDEARHVEAYKKLVGKFGIAWPMSKPLESLLEDVLKDDRWDMTYLGMQVVIEGLALAAFAMVRDQAENPLAQQVNAYVMEDEARHVAFGRLALRDYYPELSEKERDEREEFLVEACYLMRDRFEAREVWQTLDLPVAECVAHLQESGTMQQFRNFLFSRIVPIVKDIGLWGPRVRKAYEDMGIIGFASVDVDALQARDEQIAAEFDARRRHVDSVISEGAA